MSNKPKLEVMASAAIDLLVLIMLPSVCPTLPADKHINSVFTRKGNGFLPRPALTGATWQRLWLLDSLLFTRQRDTFYSLAAFKGIGNRRDHLGGASVGVRRDAISDANALIG